MKLKPQVKAKELFDHYYILIQDTGGELGQEILVSILAKQCALIAASECKKEMVEIFHYDYYYWHEVEKEIQNL